MTRTFPGHARFLEKIVISSRSYETYDAVISLALGRLLKDGFLNKSRIEGSRHCNCGFALEVALQINSFLPEEGFHRTGTENSMRQWGTMKPLLYSAISSDFDETLGYIRNDIRAISGGTHTVNYTLMLLVGCGCELLARVRAGKKQKGYRVFKELVPAAEWSVLAGKLYDALRNGLAHGFDTKRLIIGGLKVQIHMSWSQKEPFHLRPGGQKIALMLGPRPLADALCVKIDEFEQILRKDEEARRRFQSGCNCERTTEFKPHEEVAWKTLVRAAKL